MVRLVLCSDTVRLGAAAAGLVVTLVALATGSSLAGWIAIALLAISALVRMVQRRRTSV